MNTVKGSDITISSTNFFGKEIPLTADLLDPVLIDHKHVIENFGYKT